jgi:hypothetical protein
VSAPQVAVDAQGNAIAVWTGSDGTNDIAGRGAPGGQWDALSDLPRGRPHG